MLTGNVDDSGPVVVVDDTVLTGNSLKQVMPIVQKSYPDVVTAAVYANPNAKKRPDIYARELPWPHVLEWNLFNSILTPNLCVDMDGILCRDCLPGEDDDGEKYAGFLRDASLLYPIRRTPIPMIVTARLGKYRRETEAWLAKHGIQCDELVMGPWSSLSERHRADLAGYKAEHFTRFLKRKRRLRPAMFVESDPRLAPRIAELSGGIVVCPAAGRCYGPSGQKES